MGMRHSYSLDSHSKLPNSILTGRPNRRWCVIIKTEPTNVFSPRNRYSAFTTELWCAQDNMLKWWSYWSYWIWDAQARRYWNKELMNRLRGILIASETHFLICCFHERNLSDKIEIPRHSSIVSSNAHIQLRWSNDVTNIRLQLAHGKYYCLFWFFSFSLCAFRADRTHCIGVRMLEKSAKCTHEP